MSRRFVRLFDLLHKSDGIVVVGYGFNVDDNHINGMFRELVENEGKHLYWVCVLTEETIGQQQRLLLKKLRLSSRHSPQVHVFPVNMTNRQIEGELWLDAIYNHFREQSEE